MLLKGGLFSCFPRFYPYFEILSLGSLADRQVRSIQTVSVEVHSMSFLSFSQGHSQSSGFIWPSLTTNWGHLLLHCIHEYLPLGPETQHLSIQTFTGPPNNPGLINMLCFSDSWSILVSSNRQPKHFSLCCFEPLHLVFYSKQFVWCARLTDALLALISHFRAEFTLQANLIKNQLPTQIQISRADYSDCFECPNWIWLCSDWPTLLTVETCQCVCRCLH